MKVYKRVIIFVTLVLFLIPQIAYAYDQDYTLDDDKRIPIPLTYRSVRVIDYLGDEVGFFSEAEDLFIDENDNMYVVDTKNSRIIKMTLEGSVLDIFDGSEEYKLNEPKGIFVDQEGTMYIADTGNNRILVLNSKGEFLKEYTKPESELLHKDFIFDPTKVCVTPTGYIYVIKSQAFLSMDADNRFRGFIGATEVGFDFRQLIMRIFATQEQKERIARKLPASYSNFVIDDRGMVYATVVNSSKDQIRKITSVGKNVYSKGFYGERVEENNMVRLPHFVDLAVDGDGIISVLDQNNGKIYQYDQEGEILTVFGGLGDKKGKFGIPVSLDVDKNGLIYVLDSKADNIHVFEPTNFARLIHRAATLYNNGRYEESREIWEEVLSIDENYSLAHKGIAKALLKEEKWQEAMTEYTWAEDQNGYSESYVGYRHDIVRDYFGLVVLIIAGIATGLVLLFRHLRKVSEDGLSKVTTWGGESRKLNLREFFTSLIFHPVDTFYYLKTQRSDLNLISVFVMLLSILGVRIISIFITHYPIATIHPRDASIWLEMLRMYVPLMTWVVASYAITSISSGEGLLEETFAVSTYAMFPYVLCTIPIALFSRVLGREQLGIYNTLNTIMWIWVFILFFIGLKTLNDYTFGKTVGVGLISIITVFLIWGVIILLIALTSQLFTFVYDIFLEVKLLFAS